MKETVEAWLYVGIKYDEVETVDEKYTFYFYFFILGSSPFFEEFLERIFSQNKRMMMSSI